MPLCHAVHPKPVPTGSASDLFMQMAITNEAHTLDAPRGAKTGVGKRSGMGCFWGDNGWGDILTAQWKRLIWFPAQNPSIPKASARGRFGKFSGLGCGNGGGSNWSAMHVSIAQHGSSSVAARGGLLYSGTASLLKHVANICYAKATFMLNVTGWAVAGGGGWSDASLYPSCLLVQSHVDPAWKKLLYDSCSSIRTRIVKYIYSSLFTVLIVSQKIKTVLELVNLHY